MKKKSKKYKASSKKNMCCKKTILLVALVSLLILGTAVIYIFQSYFNHALYTTKNGGDYVIVDNGGTDIDDVNDDSDIDDEIEIDIDGEWLTYTNDEYGFSFDYPKDLKIEDSHAILRDGITYAVRISDDTKNIYKISVTNREIMLSTYEDFSIRNQIEEEWNIKFLKDMSDILVINGRGYAVNIDLEELHGSENLVKIDINYTIYDKKGQNKYELYHSFLYPKPNNEKIELHKFLSNQIKTESTILFNKILSSFITID